VIRSAQRPFEVTDAKEWAGVGAERINAMKDMAALKKEVDRSCR
jgi:hypothetical protein